jgi:hypothetical protein
MARELGRSPSTVHDEVERRLLRVGPEGGEGRARAGRRRRLVPQARVLVEVPRRPQQARRLRLPREPEGVPRGLPEDEHLAALTGRKHVAHPAYVRQEDRPPATRVLRAVCH